MRRALIIVILLILAGASAALAVNLCSITGVVQNPDGSACANCTITANSIKQQTVSGQIIMPVVISTTTNATGTLSGFSLAQGLVVQITISTPSGTTGVPFTAIIPFSTTVVFSNLAIQSNLTGTETLSNIGAPTSNVNFNNFTATNMACPAGNNQPEVESCPLGATTPSTGIFTTLSATTLTATTFNPTNLGAFTGKNITANSVGGPYALNDYNGLAQDTFNPEAYGALCDGSTDDTTALQAAATAAAGGTLLMPPSTCKINGTITMPASTTMACASSTQTGCTIKNFSTTLPTIVVTQGGFGGLIGMRLTRNALVAQGSGADGFQTPKTNTGVHWYTIANSSADLNDNGFNLGGTDYSTILNTNATSNANDGVLMTNGASTIGCGWVIQGGLFQANGNDGIHAKAVCNGAGGSPCSPTSLTIGQISGINTFANTGAGVEFAGATGTGGQTGQTSIQQVFFYNNVMGEDNGITGTGVDAAFSCTLCGSQIIIQGNHIENAGSSASGPTLSTPASLAAHDMYIPQNTVDSTLPNLVNIDGNAFYGAAYSGLYVGVNNATITGNRMKANGANGLGTPSNESGIFIQTGTNYTIAGNVSTGNGAGIYSSIDRSDLIIANNELLSNLLIDHGHDLVFTPAILTSVLIGNSGNLIPATNLLPNLSIGPPGGQTNGGLQLDGATAVGIGNPRIAGGIFTLSNLAVASLDQFSVHPFSRVDVTDSAGGNYCSFWLEGAGHATVKLLDALTKCSNAAGTAGDINVYWSAGNTRYEIENHTGGSTTSSVVWEDFD